MHFIDLELWPSEIPSLNLFKWIQRNGHCGALSRRPVRFSCMTLIINHAINTTPFADRSIAFNYTLWCRRSWNGCFAVCCFSCCTLRSRAHNEDSRFPNDDDDVNGQMESVSNGKGDSSKCADAVVTTLNFFKPIFYSICIFAARYRIAICDLPVWLRFRLSVAIDSQLSF